VVTSTDQELVIAFRPEAVVESRLNAHSGKTEYQVRCDPVPGKRTEKIGWVSSESLAWRAACIRMGLRVRSVPLPLC
jgi:hypothetical protein